MIVLLFGCAQASPHDDLLCLNDAVFETRAGLVAEASTTEILDDAHGRAVDPKVSGETTMSVKSETVEWDLSAGIAQFRGAVEAKRGDVLLTSTQLEVTLGEDQQIATAVATKSVRIISGERTATSERAELDVARGHLILTEAPQVESPKGTFVGDRLILWLDDDKVQCEGNCQLLISEP